VSGTSTAKLRRELEAALHAVDLTRLERDRYHEALRDAQNRLAEFRAKKSTPRVSDAELVALAAVVITESVPETPARKKLVEQLEARGVI
jgi:hypothetical protein